MILVRLTVMAMILGAVLFGTAGRLDVWGFWAWLAVVWVSTGATFTLLGRVSPGLVEERLRPPSDRDRATRRLGALPFLTSLVLAGLDARRGWSVVPPWLQLAGLGLVAAGLALVAWTLLSNPFASSAVRIQTERAHQVISTGPYALVRHPMYLAVFLVCAGGGVALGSWYAGLALLPVVALFLRRTALEDRMLREELQGYQAYAARVRWRVIPGVY
jgi:protein-S-isoprenylcysteine O-methyltransferase Ste14